MSENCPGDLFKILDTPNSSEDFSIQFSNNNKGEGFVGDVIFVVLFNKNSQEKQYLTIKQQKLTDGNIIDWPNGAFDNEILFYDQIWPTIFQRYHEKTGKSLKFVPQCMGTAKNEVKRIAMKDLKTEHFQIFEKTKAFDENHLRLIFNTYGIFHGISMALNEENEHKWCIITKDIQNIWQKSLKSGEIMGKYLQLTVSQALKFFDPIKEKCIVDKLLEYEENGTDQLCRLFNQDSVYRVITHGDCWSNNFMFKYDVSKFLFFT